LCGVGAARRAGGGGDGVAAPAANLVTQHAADDTTGDGPGTGTLAFSSTKRTAWTRPQPRRRERLPVPSRPIRRRSRLPIRRSRPRVKVGASCFASLGWQILRTIACRGALAFAVGAQAGRRPGRFDHLELPCRACARDLRTEAARAMRSSGSTTSLRAAWRRRPCVGISGSLSLVQ
jgi:hypothetical protein